MQTHVYANNQEIACKAAGTDGVSPQAFPDPCWSPPGNVVIPYPNTCYADSISNGTSTVFICGQEIAIEDESYFSTSTGDEPATQSHAKGVATGVIKGKGYFAQWSFDVVFEGFGVPRHQDMVGHNHGSMPSNTPLFPYISRGWFSHECKKEEDRIKRACQAEKEDSDAKKEIRGKSRFSSLLKATRSNRKHKGRRDRSGWHWTDDHCDGLEVSIPDAGKAMEYARQLEQAYKNLPGELNLLNALRSELQEMVVNAAGKAAMKWGAKAAVKQGVGSVVPAVGNAVMGIWSVVDGAMSIGDVAEIRRVATESLEKLDILKAKVGDLQRTAREFENFSKLSEQEQRAKAQKLAVDGQELLATLNDCTRARKCNLVPYSADGVGNPFGKRDSKNPSQVESSNGGGCCPGQTGHHLIPGAALEKSCAGYYDHGAAPTVCVEGTSQNFGSHARAHVALAREHEALDLAGRVAPDGSMSMNDALNAAGKSHQRAFPASKCSSKCIRAQLDSYYRGCRNGRPAMVDEQARPSRPQAPAEGDTI